MKNKLINMLTSAWLWAAIPALAISFFIHHDRSRYTIEVEKKFSGNNQEVYADLNRDGISEIIHGKAGPPLNKFPVMNANGRYIEQWNLPDNLTPGISELFTGDFDHDHTAEIYVFTTKDDSIFLNVNEFLDPQGLRMERIFITTVVLVQDHIDSNLKPIGFFDQNGDGHDELYFRISSGYGLVPRLCYFFDLVNKKLKSSPFTGVNYDSPHFTDLDDDGRPEIVSTITSPGNYHTPTPYTDYSAWLMVLNDQLEFRFPPIEYPGFGSAVHVFGIGKPGEKMLAVIYNYQGTSDTIPQTPGAYLYTPDRKLIRQKTFGELGIDRAWMPQLFKKGEQDLLLLVNTTIFLLDENLEIVRQQKNQCFECHNNFIVDLDGDGQVEILLFSDNSKQLAVYNAELELAGMVTLELVSPEEAQISTITTPAGEHKIYFKSGDQGFYLQLKENRYYLLGYLVYPGIYLGFVLFIGFVKKVNTRQVEKQEQQKRKIQTLQLQSIKGQLDPHFTFNALNSVASLLYHDDRNAAYDYLNQFTRLLRQLLTDAERVYRTLEEEIEFVSSYLNLEKLRFGDKFNYTIRLDEPITRQEVVPVMSIQTFAENAVKHGLMPLTEGGKLTISIEKQDGYLKVAIEDNGVGRQKAAENQKRPGHGLRTIREFYEILNQINKKPIHYTITDLYHDDGTSAGTRAEVWVPLDLVENHQKAD